MNFKVRTTCNENMPYFSQCKASRFVASSSKKRQFLGTRLLVGNKVATTRHTYNA